MESIIGQIKSNLHQGDVVQLNVKNLYDAFAKDGECKLEHCEVLKDNQYYDIATEHNKFAYGNDEHCTIEQVMDDGSVLFCTNMTENKSDRFALGPVEVAIAYFGRKQEVTRCARCGSVCVPGNKWTFAFPYNGLIELNAKGKRLFGKLERNLKKTLASDDLDADIHIR